MPGVVHQVPPAVGGCSLLDGVERARLRPAQWRCGDSNPGPDIFYLFFYKLRLYQPRWCSFVARGLSYLFKTQLPT